MASQTIAALTTAIVSIVGAITAAIVAIQSHSKTAQAVINATNQPSTVQAPVIPVTEETTILPSPFPSSSQKEAS